MTAPAAIARSRRRLALACAGLVAAAGLTGCSYFNPMQTQITYVAADGVPASIGALQVRNLLVVSAEKAAPGVIAGSLINTGDKDLEVTIGLAGSAAPGSGVTLKSGEQKPVTKTLASVPVGPGELVSLAVTTSAGQTVVQVPVLLPTDYYSTLTVPPTKTPVSAPTTATTPAATSATSPAAPTKASTPTPS